MGIPSVTVVGPGFVELGKLTGTNNGIPSIQLAVYPGPFDLHTDEALKQNAAKLVPEIVKGLTGKIETPAEPKEKKNSAERIVFSGTLEEVNRYFTDNGWSDGEAIIPPTPDRIERFLKYTDYAPDEEIAVLASANLRATPRNIAANAIMAGARPEHMPMLIAMVQSIGDPKYKVSYSRRAGSTHSFQTYYWVNGPVARQLGVDFGQGLIAHPINKVIGRTMSLIERNIAGYQIKLTQVGTFGKVTSWILAEDEEATLRLGWKPNHVEKGFDLNANTVTTGESTVWGQNLIPSTSDPKILMQLIAFDLTNKEQFAAGWNASSGTLLMTPTTAQVLAEGGYTKDKLKKDLADHGADGDLRVGVVEGPRLRTVRSIRRSKRSWPRRWRSRERRRASCPPGCPDSRVGRRSRRRRWSQIRVTWKSLSSAIRAETRCRPCRRMATTPSKSGCQRTGTH